jgi:hypothetical protein
MANTSALRNHNLKESKARWATFKMDGYYEFKVTGAAASRGEKFLSLKWQSVIQDEDERGQTVYDGMPIEGTRELKDRDGKVIEKIDNIANLAALLDALGLQGYKNELADRNVEVNEALAAEIAAKIEGLSGFGYFARRRATNSQTNEAEVRTERRAFALRETYDKSKQTGARFRVKSQLLTADEGGSASGRPAINTVAGQTEVTEQMADMI